ncbi:hypothetical protein PG997_002794 [Apiospora hydei]|uniref:Aminoglycoside phosphotransferase domain-containing protein n=1 Tax=Apiospora hydei TaxID=1337664 RepID=A0ABR1WXE0_9PEZI
MSGQAPLNAVTIVTIPYEGEIVCEGADDYEMSFEERRPKVLNVCRAYWADANHELTRVEPGRKHTGGLYYPVDITHDNGASFEEFVLYLPLHVDSTAGNAAILKAMARVEEIESLVPRVIYVDITNDNPLNYPYMLQKRIPGRLLSDIFDDLPQEQKVLVAAELGRTYRRIQSVRGNFSGIYDIVDDEDIDNEGINQALPPTKLMPFGMIQEGCEDDLNWNEVRESIKEGDDREKGQVLTRSNLLEDAPNMTAREILLLMFERWIQRNRHWRGRDFENECLERALEIVWELVDKEANAHVFSTSAACDICLNNPDVEAPQNFLVDLDGEGRPVITGIMEWDGVELVPHFVGCMPPDGLWTFGPAEEDYLDDEEEEDDDDYDFDMPDHEPLDTELPHNAAGAEVKRAFDEAVGAAFRAAAYSPDMVFAHRYFAFAACQGWQGCDFIGIEELAEEWYNRNLLTSQPEEGGMVMRKKKKM